VGVALVAGSGFLNPSGAPMRPPLLLQGCSQAKTRWLVQTGSVLKTFFYTLSSEIGVSGQPVGCDDFSRQYLFSRAHEYPTWCATRML